MRLERIRGRRRTHSSFKEKVENVQKYLKYPYSQLSKLVVILTSFAEALVVYLPGLIFSEIEMFFLVCLCVRFCEQEQFVSALFSNGLLKFCKSEFHSNTDAVCPVVF